MDNLPIYISIVFSLTTLLTIGFFCAATSNPKTTLVILLSWLVVQTFVSLSGFYLVSNTVPPRFLFATLPPLFLIILLFTTPFGKRYVDALNIKTLTILHIVRIPVEITLYLLFIHKAIPKLMTFEGRNFDILSGLTAPAIYYFGFIKKKLNRKVILAWNFICLILLLNIVIDAILSAPFAFQKFGFEQPNIAILYFPFIWLPCCVIQLVLIAHLAAIRQLLKKNKF